MICALRSSLFRLRRTGLLAKILIFSVIVGIILTINTGVAYYEILPFKRPRFLDQRFIGIAVLQLMYILPFASSVFTTSFTGNDLSFRTINNKVATGLSRVQVFLADLIVSVLATIIMFLTSVLIIFLYARFYSVRSSIRFDDLVICVLLRILIVSVAFTAFFNLLQFLFSNKFFGLVIAFAFIPALIFISGFYQDKLNQPYRYKVINEETKQEEWVLNPEYVSGTPRKILVFLSETAPFTFTDSLEAKPEKITSNVAIAAGTVVAVSTAAGIAAIKKKELS